MKEYIEFDSNSEEFAKRVKASEQQLFKVAHNGMVQMNEEWINRMKTDHFANGYYPGKTRGLKLRVRRGALRSSTGGKVSGKTLGDLKALLRIGGGRAGYAPTQEWGAPISHRYMRIPLKAALTPTGRTKPGAIPRRSGSVWKTSSFGRTVVIESGGKLFIVGRKKYKPKAKYKGNVLLFILVEKVKIPPRLRATQEVIDVAGKDLDRINQKFAKVLRVGGTGGIY